MDNLVGQVRPTSRFSSYNPQNESQKEALARFQSLSEAILAKAPNILRTSQPFSHGRIIFISGPPGVGKTHLVEALINECTDEVPDLARKIYLFRGNFTTRNIGSLNNFDGCPVLVIDDLFAEYQSIDRIHPATDVKVLMQLVTMVYEERRLVIVTSNFPLMEGIAARILAVDAIGRTASRLKELMANSGELTIEGLDYREVLAAERTADDLFGDL